MWGCEKRKQNTKNPEEGGRTLIRLWTAEGAGFQKICGASTVGGRRLQEDNHTPKCRGKKPSRPEGKLEAEPELRNLTRSKSVKGPGEDRYKKGGFNGKPKRQRWEQNETRQVWENKNSVRF